jgi:hypothetical protein
MSWKIVVFLIIFIIAILSKLIKYKFNILILKKDTWKIVGDLSIVLGEYLSFLTGLGITFCFIKNENLCGIDELNIIIVGIGVIMICGSLMGYLYSITKDFYKKKKKKKLVT